MPVTLGRTTSTTRHVGERLYYDSNHSIVLSLWSGDHYLVSIRNEDNKTVHHVLRTNNQEYAKRYVDALETLVSHYRAASDSDIAIENTESISTDVRAVDESDGRKDVYAELIKLDDLRKRGILTDAEFDAEKKKLLESK